MKTFLLEEMTWVQIKKAMDAGVRTVVIPLGAIEQHGPHIAISCDTLLGYSLAEIIARRLEKALVAPAIRPGLSEDFMEFPGSLTLRESTFRDLIEDYVDSYVRHGFTNIILAPAHGGNFDVAEDMAEKLSQKHPDFCIINTLTLEDMSKMSETSSESAEMDQTVGGIHAGGIETSEMLAYWPQYVDMSKAETGFLGTIEETFESVEMKGLKATSNNGILGDATVATAEVGKVSMEICVDYIIDYKIKNNKKFCL
ncbi:creatininase family protein [Clostridiaceae bacterium M8S5]|nr:creatininase family protein [Clostridiaceae bacterium M8S5]